MSINDLLCVGARPLQFLDYYASAKLEPETLMILLKSITLACEESECDLVGGETAEMPGIYHEKEFDLAGFAVGVCDKEHLLGPLKIKDKDRLIAFESSGFHSNGYSLVRKIVSEENILPDSSPDFSERTWKELLLEPTALYVKALKNTKLHINALAHITGGGLYENLVRVLPAGSVAHVQSEQWEIPSIFKWFASKAKLEDTELLATFNCGVGMIAACSSNEAKLVIEEAKASGVKAWEVGHIELEKNGDLAPEILWH